MAARRDPLAEGHEDFDEAWNNDIYLSELPSGQIIAAPFGGGTVEDMENAWRNLPYALDWGAVTATFALFDGEPREDFEDAWRNNQSFAWLWTQIRAQAAFFDRGTDQNEDFENSWTPATTI